MNFKRETVLSIIGIVIALVSLGISLKSCNQSERAVNLQEKEFYNSRSAVWTLKFTNQDNPYLSSVSDEIKLQKAFIYFPPGFGIAAEPIKSPDYVLHTEFAEKAIKIGISQINSSDVKRKIFGPISSVPVVVESWYVAKGNSYRDIALYSLEFSTKSVVRNTINISGLSFARRLNSNGNIRDILRQEWQRYQSM